MCFLEDISENDYIDWETAVYEYIYTELNDNIMLYNNKNFYDNLIYSISSYYFDLWKDIRLCNDEHEEDIEKFVKKFVFNFFNIYQEFPLREYCEISNIPDNEDIVKKIEIINNIPQPKQRTMEWYEYRYGLLTASNIWKAFSSQANRNSLIYEKCKPFDPLSSNKIKGGSLTWGNVFEPLSIKIYEEKYNTNIEDYGCIQHPKYKYIGASPDGININPDSNKFGRMLEVKNIYNREINGIPKDEYWIQMQMQLETCDLEICDFLETRFIEFNNIEEFYNDNQEYRGLVLYFIKNNETIYKYLPLNTVINEENIAKWKNDTIEEMNDHILIKENYWYLDEFSCVVVKRNKKWFEAAVPIILEIWNIILKERKEGFEHRAPKRRLKPTEVYISNNNENNDNTETHIIHNLEFNNNINLIKLK
jgi:putative phage-type endonuclease